MFQAIRKIHRNIDDELDKPESTSPTRDEEPEKILFGKYEVRRLLGVGGFAKVYEACDVVTKQSVAIKIISRRRIVEAGLTAQVEREIAIMRRLNHPHIVKLYEVRANRSKIYFVMEFAKGGELFERIVNEGRFSQDHNRQCFQQLISAVQHCHENGAFHRDLKLDNLLLDEDLNIKVSDFGLSATMDQIRTDGLLHTICGTPAYVAPEMLANKGYDGRKVDVWQCGVVLFVLTTGYLPFNDPSVPTLLRRIYRGQFRVPGWVPPDLKGFIQRLLDPNPRTRITVDEIQRDPWFRKGYKEIKVEQKIPEWDDEDRKSLNAFHLISFSSGLDMSGLFITGPGPEVLNFLERIVSRETPKRITDIVEEVAEGARVTVTRKEDESGAKVEGQDGNFMIFIGIYRLTDELVVIEIKDKESGSGSQYWKDKLRPRLIELEYQPEAPVTR